MRGDVKEECRWVEILLQSSPKERKQVVRSVLEGLKLIHTKTGEPTEEGVRLYDRYLSKNFEVVGILTNLRYIRIDGSREQLKNRYLHAWGMPVLIVKEKGMPVLHLVAPGIRLNGSVVQEIGGEYPEQIIGFTG